MFLFYIDENGSSGGHHTPYVNGETPLFCLSALGIDADSWHSFDREYLELKRKFFAKEIGERRAEYWEIKGNELTKPSNRTSRPRWAFLNEVLKLCESYDVNYFSTIVIKNSVTPTPTASLYGQALQILVERFQAYLEEMETSDTGLMIVDSRVGKLDDEVAKGHLSFVFGNSFDRKLDRIIEAPLFASSALSAGLQIVDIIGSCIYAYNYFRNYATDPNALDYSHVAKIWPSVESRQLRSASYYDGFRRSGFRIIDFSR